MVWYSDLYTGKLISPEKDKVRHSIEAGTYPAGVYLLVIPGNEENQLEIFKAGELRHSYVRRHLLMIAGIAFTKEEAKGLAQRIVQDTVNERGDADVRAFLLNKAAVS